MMGQEPVFLRRSLRFWAWSAVACVAATIFGVVCTILVEVDGRLIVMMTVAGPASVAFTIKALRRTDGLTLDTDGFSYNVFSGVKRYRWADCSEIRPSHPKSRSGGRVVFGHPATDRTLWGRAMRLLNQLSGWLPEPYGLNAHVLASMMNERRDRVIARVDRPAREATSAGGVGLGRPEERRYG